MVGLDGLAMLFSVFAITANLKLIVLSLFRTTAFCFRKRILLMLYIIKVF